MIVTVCEQHTLHICEHSGLSAAVPLVFTFGTGPTEACSSADTEALSQGCSSALLFRDNDKALNPSVDLTFVPSIFKLPCVFQELRSGRCWED